MFVPAMAAYQNICHQTTSRTESPAKVFAKLKSKVDRDASSGKDEGVYTRNDLLGKVKGKPAAEFMSPRKRTEPYWTSDELDENRGFGFVGEAQALTISPMSSPRSDFGSSREDPDWSSELAEEDALSKHGCTPRKGGFLESTVRSQPFQMASRIQSLTEAPQVRDSFDVIRRTQQQKIQAAENEVRSPLTAPSSVFSPMRSRLRQRTLQPSGLHNESSPCVEAQTFKNTHKEDLIHTKRLPSRRFDKNQTMFPAQTRGSVVEDKVHLMSPAKMFAYMKERESKPEQQEGRRPAGSRNLFGNNRGHFHQTTSPPASTDEEDDSASHVDRKTLSSPLGGELADSQSDTDLSDDVRVPAVLSQRVLLDDPLILNSPQVSIPKNHRRVFKNNNWPQSADPTCENEIHLSRWFLRRKGKDLFLEGIHREKNILWNSNVIVRRVSNLVLKTTTGSVYILDGRMNLNAKTGFPKWFLKKFHCGFPSNWRKLLDEFLSTKKEKNSTERSSLRARSESNFIAPPPPPSSATRKARESVKTPDNTPPAPPTSTKVSRSGRVIKPPLEYWKGGRVIIDAHMNVTIHESYDTSLCNTEANATMVLRPSARLFSPCDDERQPSKAAAAREATEGPVRKTTAPVPRRDRVREKPAHLPEAPPKRPHRRRISSSSSEGERGGGLRSSQKGGAVEPTPHANVNSHNQTKENRKPWKQQRDGKKPPVASSQRERSASRRSPAADSDDQPLLNESIGARRGRRRNEVRSYREEELQHDRKAAKKAGRPHRPAGAAKASGEKRSKAGKTSGSTKPKPSSRKRKADSRLEEEEDEEEEEKRDQWTESEVMKLNEAVKVYPRHMGDLWAKVAKMVGTRSAEECHLKHTLKNMIKSPVRKQVKKKEKQKGSGSQDAEQVVISARVGTLRRKQQVRQFLENMPKDDHDDIFTLATMRNKAFERLAACPFSTTNNQEFSLSNLGPLSPERASYPLVKTPSALPISPNMLGSPNCANDDKFVYHLQKKVKKNQVNACKRDPAKTFKLTPSVKRAVKRCGDTENDDFVVWEMFPGKENPPIASDSEEENDFYFSDNE